MDSRQNKYHIFPFLLALLVFFSSAGIVLPKHHCQLKAQNESLSCADTGCQKGCCSTELQYFQLDQDQSIPSLDNGLNSTVNYFFVATVNAFIIVHEGRQHEQLFFNYKPPPLLRDIPVLVQSFLL